MDENEQDDGGAGKKMRATTREPSGSLYMLRCAHLGLSVEALNDMTMGMVYDMLIEEGNDREDYPFEATQNDINSFFG